jgi:hypothetical protein
VLIRAPAHAEAQHRSRAGCRTVLQARIPMHVWRDTMPRALPPQPSGSSGRLRLDPLRHFAPHGHHHQADFPGVLVPGAAVGQRPLQHREVVPVGTRRCHVRTARDVAVAFLLLGAKFSVLQYSKGR